MENFRELAERRYSCRRFKSDPVPHELLTRCVETASLAPSGCNSQPWRFTIVTDDKMRAELVKKTQILGLNAWSTNVPAYIVVSEAAEPKLLPIVMEQYKNAKLYATGDVGMATAYLVLEAKDLGLDTCILGLFTSSEIVELLDLPKGDTVRAIVAVGYSEGDSARPKKRKPLDEIMKII